MTATSFFGLTVRIVEEGFTVPSLVPGGPAVVVSGTTMAVRRHEVWATQAGFDKLKQAYPLCDVQGNA